MLYMQTKSVLFSRSFSHHFVYDQCDGSVARHVAGSSETVHGDVTYTQGGGVISTLLGLYSTGATIVGTGVLAASYAWGIQQTRDWLKQPGNKEGNIFTVYGRALDALSADMKKSSSNFLRDGVSAVTVCALAPVSLVLILRK